MAISPVAPQAPKVLEAQDAQVRLAAAYTGTPVELFADSGVRTAQAIVGAPLGFNLALAALAAGQPEAAYNALEAVIDGPLWAADPAIYALDDIFPAPIGGQEVNEPTGPNDSAITQFRADVLIALRDALRGLAAQAVGYDVGATFTTLAVQETYTGSPAELFALSAVRSAQAFLGAPLGVAQAATLLAQGKNAEAYAVLENVVDGPLWAADPAIYALDDIFPAPIGGDLNIPTQPGTGAITQFRAQVLIAARDAVRGLVRQAVGAPQPTGRVAVTAAEDDFDALAAAQRLAEGFGESAVRTVTTTAAAPLGLVAVVDGLKKSFDGEGNESLYVALRQFVDAPLYNADPAIFALDDVLPQPIGGDPAVDKRFSSGSAITKFRADVLWTATKNVRTPIAEALDVDPNLNEVPTNKGATVEKAAEEKPAEVKKPTRPLQQLRESFDASRDKAGDTTETKGGKHRAPTTGLGQGLRNLFGKKNTEDKAQDAPASDAPSDSE